MMKIPLNRAEARVTLTIERDGSILGGTVRAGIRAVHTHLTVETDVTDSARLTRLIRAAERSCFVLAAIRDPHEPTLSASLNGAPFALDAPAPTPGTPA